ncbi:hypothetical protein [Streptomyces edwardsiae]|uniref:Uncharacterized protein n=1 Tax=Streptomyces edwardsiae TaxID=3075527 RepID=A0ABU2QEE9_9ACTN|nr:hypothetical protein [Streptomyces sp. DSM 41635]MDT0402801.1 hypothetical protein [Streptomyces sp. DSM 41635]
MSNSEKANEAVIGERNELAGRVAEALKAAGFNALAQESDRKSDAGGALVLIDPLADSRGGVFVQWTVHASLHHTVAEKAHNGEIQEPVFQHFSFVTEWMYTTMIAVLESAGFRAVDAEDDMSPYMVRVEDRAL